MQREATTFIFLVDVGVMRNQHCHTFRKAYSAEGVGNVDNGCRSGELCGKVNITNAINAFVKREELELSELSRSSNMVASSSSSRRSTL